MASWPSTCGRSTRAPGPLRMRRLAHGGLLLWGLTGAWACGADTSIVELDWAFVDYNGEPIFPGGSIIQNRDTCALDGRDELGTTPYALNVALVIEDLACLEDLADAGSFDTTTCEVSRETFDCDRARGAITGVPISDEPYLMRVEVWADPEGSEAEPFEVDSSCIAIPGPRTRKVEGGRITDLAVYQLVANGIELGDSPRLLDLSGCRASDPAELGG